MKKVLVTGGAGYIGSILVPKLISNGFDVRVLDLMIFGSQGLKSVSEQCEIMKGDIRDSKLVEKCLGGIDSVIHLAAISNDPCSDLNPKLTKEVNLEATKNLVESAQVNSIKRFIYASSSSVYGIREEPDITEELSLKPLTIYSETKAESEVFVREANTKDFTTVILRPATVCGYSPRMRLDLTVNILTEQAINKGKITVFGGKQKRPNIHIEDITDYYVSLLKIEKEKIAGETFNAGYENHTLLQIAELIKEVIGDVGIVTTETNDLRSYHISSRKIKDRLGFYPQKTIKDAVTDLKYAFSKGLIPNPSDTIYRNIARMKEIGIENF